MNLRVINRVVAVSVFHHVAKDPSMFSIRLDRLKRIINEYADVKTL